SLFGRRELIRLSTTYNDSLEERQYHSQILEQQNWQRAGQAQLGERSVGQMSLPALGQTILDFLVQYLDASAAVFYSCANKQKPECIANYGLHKEDENKQFDSSDSLIAQVRLSKRIIE